MANPRDPGAAHARESPATQHPPGGRRASEQSGEEWRDLADQVAGVGAFDWDIVGGRFTSSPEVYRLHGVDRGTPPTSDEWLATIHPDDRPWIQDAIAALTAAARGKPPFGTSGTPVDRPAEREYRVVLADGAVRWIASRTQVVFDALGRPARVHGADVDVTDRREVEAALRESEAHYRHMVELNPQVPWTADAAGRVLDISHRWSVLTGLDREDTLGDGWQQAVHPDDLSRVTAAWRQAVETGGPYDQEYRTRAADGSYRWMRMRASPRRDSTRRITGWYGFSEDVHDRRAAEEALRASEERLRLATAALAGFLYEWDPNTNRVSWFGGSEEILGFRLDEVTPDVAWYVSRIHPDDRARAWDGARAALESGADGHSAEYRILHRDGHYVDVVDRSRIVRDAGHGVRVFGGIVDISARRHAERANQRLLGAAVAARERLARVLAQVPAAVAITRGPGHVLESTNQECRRLFGERTPGLAVREAFPELVPLGFVELMDRAYATGEAVAGTEAPVTSTIDGDAGTQRRPEFVNFVFQPLTGPGGEVDGILLLGVDVTALVRARTDAEAARREAEQANAAKGRFLAATSHDLRTPLFAIIGYAELLDHGRYGPVTPQQGDALRRINRAGQHLLTLINDILQFAKLEAGQMTVGVAEVPLTEICGRVEAMVAPEVAERGINYTCDVTDPEGPTGASLVVRADRDRMLQVVLNLVTNAVKYTDSGGTVALDAAADEDSVSLRVRDTGRGIPADHLEAIFEPFVQVGEAKLSGPGVGLGLAICRDLARAMGGNVTVESVVGTGSTFTLTLPRARIARQR